MKMNLPITNQEIQMKKNGLLVTRTNLKGIITYANDEFVNISGYTRHGETVLNLLTLA